MSDGGGTTPKCVGVVSLSPDYSGAMWDGGGEPAVLSSHSLSLMASVTPVPPCVREGVARLLQEM